MQQLLRIAPARYDSTMDSILRPCYGHVFRLAASVTPTSAFHCALCGKNDIKSWPHGAGEGTEKRKDLMQKS